MTDLREAIARRIAARKTGVACRTGIGLPDDIWRQALPDADDALAAIEAANWGLCPPGYTLCPLRAEGKNMNNCDACKFFQPLKHPMPHEVGWGDCTEPGRIIRDENGKIIHYEPDVKNTWSCANFSERKDGVTGG